MVKMKKKQYAQRIEKELSSDNVRQVYSGIKSVMGIKEKASSDVDSGMGEQLNDFYARFDIKDYSKEKEEIKQRLEACIEMGDSEARMVVRERDVFRLFSTLDCRKACGPDKIRPDVLKSCKASLTPTVTMLFNRIISERLFPKTWKEAIIVPIPKKINAREPNEFRPVALTSILSKCFERIVKDKLLQEIKTPLDPLQFAYRANLGTEDALATMVHKIVNHLDKNSSNYARCLLLDFSSAFNTIQPHVLIGRLTEMGVPSALSLIILDFLECRPQRVRTLEGLTSCKTLSTGSPQGCVLSPLLFTLYTDELRGSNPASILLKYADDVAIIGLIEKSSILFSEMSYFQTINETTAWCQNNYLVLNESKTKEVIFDFRKNKCNYEDILINGRMIERVKEVKYLGVVIDNKLEMGEHVNQINRKMQRRMFLIKKMKGIKINIRLVSRAYISFVESLCRYGYIVFAGMLSKKNQRRYLSCCRVADKMGLRKEWDFISSLEKQKENFIAKIEREDTHPLHWEIMKHFTGGRRKWSVPYCRTTRFQNCLIPQLLMKRSRTFTFN